MQDRPLEAHLAGDFGVAMDDVAVARKPVQQRLPRQGVGHAHQVGRAHGHGLRGVLQRGARADAAVAAREIQVVDVIQWRAILQAHTRVGLDQQPLGRTLVVDLAHAMVGQHLGGWGQWPVQRQLLRAVQHLGNVQADVIDQVVARHGHGLGGHGAQCAAAIVDEVQFARVEGVASHAHGQAIEHAVAFGVGMGDVAGALRHQEVVGDGWHRNVLVSFGWWGCG